MAAERRCILPVLILAALAGLLSTAFAAYDFLASGEQLLSGESLINCGRTLTMQTDCNLVLYDRDERPIWATGSQGQGTDCRLAVQSDGNLVIYDGGRQPVWESSTIRGNGQYVLVLRRDRNVVLYGGVYWSTGTKYYGGATNGSSSGAVVVVNAAGEGGAGLGR